jgi:hypothetical protein
MSAEVIMRRSTRKGSLVKVYAQVPSRSEKGKFHTVVYIRSSNFRGCLCDCGNFLFEKMAKNRNCDHIKGLRQQYGRYFTKVV